MIIQMNVNDLVGGLSAVSLALGNDTPNLLIETTGTAVHFVGSNGHWLVEYACPMQTSVRTRVGVCGVSLRTMLPAIKRLSRGKEHQLNLLLGEPPEFPEDKPKPVRIEHGLGAVTLNGVSLSDVGFADSYNKLIRPDDYPAPEAWFAASADYLSDLAEAFTAAGSNDKAPTILLRTGGECDPVHATSDAVPGLTVILMPVRSDGRTDFKKPTRGATKLESVPFKP